jgi:hypothetical protein
MRKTPFVTGCLEECGGADKAFSGIDSLATCTSYTITLRLSNTGHVERTSYGARYLNDTVAVQNALS